MKKLLIAVLISVFSLTLLTSCRENRELSEYETTENAETEKRRSAPENTGTENDPQNTPDEMPAPAEEYVPEDFASPYVFRFENLSSVILNLAGRDEVNAWLNEYETKKRSDPFTPVPTVLSFVEKFNIPKEKLAEAISDADFQDGWIITPSDIDIIYSGDDQLIKETFVNEYALLYNGKIYTPYWFYVHSESDYINEGLPAEEVKAYLTKTEALPFYDKAIAVFEARTQQAESVKEIEMPEPFDRKEGSDGDSLHDFYSNYAFRFGNINSTISSLVDHDESEEWINNYFAEVITNPEAPEKTLKDYIEYFNIPKEKLAKAVAEADFPEGWIITPSDVEVIYSCDENLIKETFVNEYALLYNGKIYSSEWLYEHSTEDYLKEGLTLEEITAYLLKMQDFPFTEEARAALSAKTELAREVYSVAVAEHEEQETVVITEAPKTEDISTTPEITNP